MTHTSLDSQAKALLAAQAALEKQADHVVVADLRTLSTVTDFFVMCTAGSSRQIAALKDHLDTVLPQHGCRVWHMEGSPKTPRGFGPGIDAPQWVLLDCGDVVIHLLDERARAFYRLEDLWADAPRIPVQLPDTTKTRSPTETRN